MAAGAGAVALAAAAVVAGRAAARRLRARPDPEAGEPFWTLPPDDLGPARSYDGTPLAVRAAGPQGAPAILFAHGITLDMTTWHYQWRALSDRFRCVLFDHRAHGRSGHPPSGDYSLAAVGRDLRAVLDHAVPNGPVVLVGHSMGGMAIISLADQFPEEFGARVSGAVLVDTAASGLLREFMGEAGSRIERASRFLTDRYVSEPERAEWMRRLMHGRGQDFAFLFARATNFGPDASAAQIDYVTRLSTGASIEVWTRMLRSLMEMDLRDAVASIRVPALVVVGDRDTLTPVISARRIRDRLPDARAVVLRRAGHVTMMEQHGAFNRILAEYLPRVLATEPAAR